MTWMFDETFDYIDTDNKPITVSWNMDGDDIEISTIEWEDKKGKSHYTSDELWEMDSKLYETLLEYISEEFLESEDFWLEKHGYDL
jgi:hypothetical protein